MAAQPPANDEQPTAPASLRERLAELEHEQWIEWSRTLAAGESLSAERLARWHARWVPYAELTEEAKELDRAYADRILALLGVVSDDARSDVSQDGRRDGAQ